MNNQQTPEAAKTAHPESEQGGCPVAPCSALASALDEGQEVRMFKLMGSSRGYCVAIHGDCYCESLNKETLEEAIAEASAKYAKRINEPE